MIWRVWGGKAIDTSIELSHAKYETARHLEEVARAHNLFNSRQRSNFAVSKADNLIINYLSRREDHFKFVFNQKIAFLLLYAFASSAFLGVGGYLVIINELTLGQLIASELILTTVFYGISRISYYLKDVYYLAASVDEISQVYDIPLEKNLGKIEMGEDVPDIKYDNAHFNVVKNEISINLDIKSCDKIMFGVESQIYEYAIIESLKKYRIPVKGSIKIGENNIVDIISEDLRDKIVILDSATVIESTIKEYLTIGNPNASTAEIDNALKVVGLYDLVYSFDKKLNTKLDISGRPFTPSETLRFKIANVLISKPKILILNELFDAISYEKRTQIFSHLCELKNMSLLYFSTRQDLDIFQKYIYISKDQCKEFKDLEDFKKCQY
jgi:putative ABC transport system ATP-binding protein